MNNKKYSIRVTRFGILVDAFAADTLQEIKSELKEQSKEDRNFLKECIYHVFKSHSDNGFVYKTSELKYTKPLNKITLEVF